MLGPIVLLLILVIMIVFAVTVLMIAKHKNQIISVENEQKADNEHE